jgi:hypothetical protein
MAVQCFASSALARGTSASSKPRMSKNPDGSMVLVLTNPGDAGEVTVACSGQTPK